MLIFGIVLCVLRGWVCKVDDLNSISCLLSMRLCRHANNRKFALTGIDQQPLTASHDSEINHDSSAFYFLTFPLKINTAYLSLGLYLYRMTQSVPGGKKKNTIAVLPAPWDCVCVWRSHACQPSLTQPMSNKRVTRMHQSITTGCSCSTMSLWSSTSQPFCSVRQSQALQQLPTAVSTACFLFLCFNVLATCGQSGQEK